MKLKQRNNIIFAMLQALGLYVYVIYLAAEAYGPAHPHFWVGMAFSITGLVLFLGIVNQLAKALDRLLGQENDT